MPPALLQIGALHHEPQALLDARYDVRHWPGDAAARPAWLAANGAGIEGLVTTGGLGVPPGLVEALPDLRIVAINGVGFDRVDLAAMRARDIRVSNTPDVLTDDVADLAIALMLNCFRRLPAAERHVRDGVWPRGEVPLARRASGLRYGIVGLGRIGQAIARRLSGFGGSIAYSSPTRRPHLGHAYHETLVSLAQASDVLFVAAAASAATAHMIDREVIEALGPNGVLVNIARGSVVDEAALEEALRDGRLGGAGLDVFAEEPVVPEGLRELPNVALAPHVGSATHETRAAMGALVVENLDSFFGGRELLTPVV
ncbi:2-hydroxyacid dehydrogenase [Rhizosaccharibacter radicis]|uniref:2-hydroxyacid dehydrogenase n=1 Tax=Rhizosaccharibacter radicis TaxID=2782605 RepID=A0ABT1VVM6_9PROT|nr:2-hydroxyacid dehydrogenase [Acetobacteraceae bacterium KSS12]